MAAAHAQSIQIRVLAASTGICYPIGLHPNELTVANIRRHLAGAVPPQDQILLLGPPYKVPKDSTLRSEEVLASLRLGDLEDDPNTSDLGGGGDVGESGGGTAGGGGRRRSRGILSTTERTGAKRLFLFSKQALSEASPDPAPCALEPMELTLPTEPDPSPVVFRQHREQQQQQLQQQQHWQQQQHGDGSSTAGISPPIPSSPLHQALEVYERRFMLHLCRGRALADGADMRLSAMRTCAAEQAVMARALRAAVSNLSDHRNGAARTRTEFTATFQSRTAGHAALLQRFEGHHLQSLASHPLHPSLVSVARASGRVMETLLDTVPVERERAWAQQCQTSHQRLVALFAELDASFAQLGTAASREEEARSDLEAEEEVKALSEEVEGTAAGIRDRQAKRLDRLTSDHGEVVRVVMRAISGGDGGGGGQQQGGAGGQQQGGGSSDAQAAFTTLEEMSRASADVLPSMGADDVTLKEMMVRVADAKTRAMRRMRQRLRQVSAAQSAIQRVLSSVAVLRDALSQQCDNMVHLEHVAELPASYRDFLSEIRRRRAYGGAVTSTSEAMIERLASMRADEVKARERFLRGSGRHLMPAFFEIFAPTLATPPPLFTPQLPALVEMDTLPDVGAADDTDKAGAVGGGSFSLGSNEADTPMQKQISADTQGVSSASTLTDSQPQQQDEKGAMSTDREAATVSDGVASAERSSADTSAAADVPAAQGIDQQSLIVSADENSNDIIMETAGHEQDEGRAAAEAERKTLAYENAVLRQAIERMGGKTPRKYIEEAQEREGGEPSRDPSFSAMKAELDKLRKELEVTKKKAGQVVKTIKEGEEEADEGEEKEPCDKISHSSFAVGDVGLFMPTGRGSGGKRTYLAFHSNCPHRYLSTDSIDGNPDYVLGRIVYQEELVAGAVNTDSNPYALHPGTKFWVLTVEVLKVP